MKAVIVADIVDYTLLTKGEADIIIKEVRAMLNELNGIRSNLVRDILIKRGDNIQFELENPKEALKVALILKTVVNKIVFKNENKSSPEADIRIAIGIGNIEAERESVDESSGEAYITSGRTVDKMKKSKRMIAVKMKNKEIEAELETEFRLLEVIMSGWLVTSAEVLYLTLLGQDAKQIANKFGVTVSAINQRKKTAGWSGIEALLERFSDLIKREGL